MAGAARRGAVLGGVLLLVSAGCGAGRPPVETVEADAGPVVVVGTVAGPLDVSVVLTADNAYAFGWGDHDGLRNIRARPTTVSAADIFSCPTQPAGQSCGAEYCGPEAYVVPADEAPVGAYLYVVAWSDFAVTQGLIGQFRRGDGAPLYTGDAAWEACATGVAHADGNDPGPSVDDVNAKVALCNAGDARVPSRGWVGQTGAVTPGATGNVVVGEANAGNAGNFPIVCRPTPTTPGVEEAAHWMWYAPEGFEPGQAFHDNDDNATQTYLVFRLPAASVPSSPLK